LLFSAAERIDNGEFKLLNPDNTVTLNRPLAHALGTNEAIVYSALIAKHLYYVQHEMLDADGYFYSTIADLHESTGLTRYQQDGAIKNLTEIGLIECCKKEIPARRFFRVNDNAELLGLFLKKGERFEVLPHPSPQESKRGLGIYPQLNVIMTGVACQYHY